MVIKVKYTSSVFIVLFFCLSLSAQEQQTTVSALSSSASSKANPVDPLTGVALCNGTNASTGCMGIDASGACPASTTTCPVGGPACGTSCTNTTWSCQKPNSQPMMVNQIPLYYITYGGTNCGDGRRYPSNPTPYASLNVLSPSSQISDPNDPTLNISNFNQIPKPVTFNSYTCVGIPQTINGPACSVNGSCGSANGSSTSSSAPTSGLCASGTASAVTGTGPWNWTCSGTGGGTTAACSATPQATCNLYFSYGTNCGMYQGDEHGSGGFVYFPNDCQGPYLNNADSYLNTYAQSEGLSNYADDPNLNCLHNASTAAALKYESCAFNSDDKTYTGACGPYTWTLHTSGTESAISPGISYACLVSLVYTQTQTTSGGTCAPAIAGTCGSSSGPGAAGSGAPSSNLCATGTASSVSGSSSGPWTWTCAGSNGGSTASCSASSSYGCAIAHPMLWTASSGKKSVQCAEYYNPVSAPHYTESILAQGKCKTLTAGYSPQGPVSGSETVCCTSGVANPCNPLIDANCPDGQSGTFVFSNPTCGLGGEN